MHFLLFSKVIFWMLGLSQNCSVYTFSRLSIGYFRQDTFCVRSTDFKLMSEKVKHTDFIYYYTNHGHPTLSCFSCNYSHAHAYKAHDYFSILNNTNIYKCHNQHFFHNFMGNNCVFTLLV